MTATGRRLSQSVSEYWLFHGFPVFTTIARTIVIKYKRAIVNESESREYFQDLSSVPTSEEIEKWEAEISEAEIKRTSRPEAMDVMAPRIPKGQFI
jgi:hypothetical protein